MSRAPPFPTRRRSPTRTNGSINGTQPPFSPPPSNTRPLQVSRAERPTTPGNNPYLSNASQSSSYVTGQTPLRPQRSERRNRVSDYEGSEQASYRDSISTTHSDISVPSRVNAGALSPLDVSQRPRPRPQRLQSPVSEDGNTTTPTSLTSAISAFTSAGLARRTGTIDEEQYIREREKELEAEKARQKRIREKVPGRRVTGRARPGDIDAVLDQVKDEWEFIIDPEFNNVDLALQLLDDSGHGKDFDSFRETKELLSRALKGSVDKHYQAFAAALPHQAALLTHLGTTSDQIQAARTSLSETKDALGNKRTDLMQLWQRSQSLEEMMRILDQIDHLKAVPDLLETLISEKRLLQASVLLIRSLKTINTPDMLEIGAMLDLRSYLSVQETALREILVDELQNHLYLKSFWCDTRWAAYVPNQQTFPAVEFEEVKITGPASTDQVPASPELRLSRQERFLNDLAIKPNEPPIDLSDVNPRTQPQAPAAVVASNALPINPESDSFAYMETLIESLAVLGKLGTALDTIAQRIPSEIFSLVESTISEAEERAEYGRRRSISAGNIESGKPEDLDVVASEKTVTQAIPTKGVLLKFSSLRLASLESSSKIHEQEVLRDLFWTLYSKLDAVAQGFKIVSEIANRVGSRRDFKDPSGAKPGSLFPLAEVWQPVQTEVRALIRDYLTNEDQGLVSGRNPISSINEILRDGKFIRDKSKSVFRFADTNAKITSRALRPHEEGLTRILNDTVPGLVPGPAGESIQSGVAFLGNDDRVLGSDQHHKLIIRPDAFNVTVLVQPTLAFFHRVKDILPSVHELELSANSILNEFVLKVYLPQLEEKVSDLFHQAVTGPTAFQADPSSALLSHEPLLKASTQLMALINSLCAMLRTSPFHQENYSRLVLSVIIQFYQRCSDRFQDLISIPSLQAELEPKVALAAQWAQRSELATCESELFNTSELDTAKHNQLCKQETNLELQLLGQHIIDRQDLITTLDRLSSLALLYRSVTWFAECLKALKLKPDENMPSSTPQTLEPLTAATPYTPHIIPSLSSDELKLPLTKEMSMRYQALLQTYEQLSNLILNTIRTEIRCRTIYHLDSSMRKGDYAIDCEPGGPDPYVVDLNSELIQCDSAISTHLPERDRQFVFVGLGQLMEYMLILNARLLRVPSSHGIHKVLRNILALQQSIKTLGNEQQNTEFERAKQYYSLYFLGPQEMLKGLRERQTFSFEEYQTMLSMQCGIDTNAGESGVANARDRQYSIYIIELHGLELEG